MPRLLCGLHLAECATITNDDWQDPLDLLIEASKAHDPAAWRRFVADCDCSGIHVREYLALSKAAAELHSIGEKDLLRRRLDYFDNFARESDRLEFRAINCKTGEPGFLDDGLLRAHGARIEFGKSEVWLDRERMFVGVQGRIKTSMPRSDRDRAKPPTTQSKHPGGRPPTVKRSVEAWWNTQPGPIKQRLNNAELARRWAEDNPGVGTGERAAQIIGELRDDKTI